jgi:hypothetical protein
MPAGIANIRGGADVDKLVPACLERHRQGYGQREAASDKRRLDGVSRLPRLEVVEGAAGAPLVNQAW